MYPDEPVVVVWEMALAVGALPFQLLVAERMVVGRHLRVWSAPPYSILRSGRQSTSVGAEARARFEAGDVDS